MEKLLKIKYLLTPINVLPPIFWSKSTEERTFITKYWVNSFESTVYKHETSMITRRVTRYLTPSEPNFLLWSFFIQRVWEIYGFLFDSRLHILVSIGFGFYFCKTSQWKWIVDRKIPNVIIQFHAIIIKTSQSKQ